MEFIVKIAALIVGASLLQEPKACPCNLAGQYTSKEMVTIYLVEYNKKRCKVSIDMNITITSEGSVFDQFIITQRSSKRGLLSKQTVNNTFHLVNDFVAAKGEEIWIEIQPVTENQFLVTL